MKEILFRRVSRKPPCPSHNDPRGWLDAPAEGGRIRTVCSSCGGFIGRRPA